MSRLFFSPRALQDMERLTNFLLESDPEAAESTTGILIEGLKILQSHPLMGRPVEHGYRELLISRGRTGYIAFYRYDALKDIALILAVRRQRELDF